MAGTEPATLNLLDHVVRTPLVRLRALERSRGPRLFAKCEFWGPGRSIFDRAAAAEIARADRGGHLSQGRRLLAAGGGDASISLAMAASARGSPLTVLVPESVGLERRKVLAGYGATLEFVDEELDWTAQNARALERATESRGVFLDLFEGEAVVQAYEAIGTELVASLGEAPSLTVCGLDLGAIPTGVARGLWEARVVAVEPLQARIASAGTWAKHLLLGLAPAPRALALDRARVQDFEAVDERAAWEAAEELGRRAGVFAGIVSGALLVAARRRMESMGPDDTVALVLPDSGERRLWLARAFS